MFDSDVNIGKMDFKQLRNYVQLLRDELAVMQRKYEDILYNLDYDNFSSHIVKEKDNMKAEIKVTAEEISSAVSKTADIKNAVEISDLSEATDISKVYKIPALGENGKVISEEYYYYNSISKSWEKLSGDTVYTMFSQTAEGFLLKGNTVIDGNATITRNLTLSGNVTWDMSNSPVKTQYSPDSVMWHEMQDINDKYMRMSFDGGRTWSLPTKVVGTDGLNGTDGSDADVTPQNVFKALTDDGDTQGLFSAFYNDGNKLFINAEYIQAGILRGQTVQSFMSSEASGYGTYAELNGLNGSLDFYYKSKSSLHHRFTMYQDGGETYIKNIGSRLWIGNKATSSEMNTTSLVGDWDFSTADSITWGNNAPAGSGNVAVFG